MQRLTGSVRAGVLALALVALGACSPTFRNHGYVPTDRDLQGIVVGVDTRGSVETLVGQPTTGGVLDDSGWYYVRSRFKTVAYFEPEEVDRQVVAITFDDQGVVRNIERFGIEDGRIVRLSRRVTDSNTQGVGFLRQALGNLGRFTAEDFFN